MSPGLQPQIFWKNGNTSKPDCASCCVLLMFCDGRLEGLENFIDMAYRL